MLRDYQIEAIDRVFVSFERLNSVLLQMPTGTGKTNVFCEVIRRFRQKNSSKRIIILVHRIELLDQIVKRLKEVFNIRDVGEIRSGYELKIGFQIQIAMINTLKNKLRDQEVQKFLQNNSLIVIDEAHHSVANTFLQILAEIKIPETKILGVTATLIRLDGSGFKNVFDKLITSNSIKWFIENKYLSKIKHYASNVLRYEEISIIRVKAGEYDEKEVEKKFINKTIMADSYIDQGRNKKCIVFAATRKHAEEISNRYNAERISSRVIDGFTHKEERKEIVRQFKSGEVQVLVNVDIFSEGFDFRDIEVVQIARPTKSLVKYLLMVGRATRYSPNKEFAIILDNACLWQEHDLATQDREWSLKGCETKETKLKQAQIVNGESKIPSNLKEIKEVELVEIVENNPQPTETGEITYHKLGTDYSFTFDELMEKLEQAPFDLNNILINGKEKVRRTKALKTHINYIQNKFADRKTLRELNPFKD